MSKPIATTSGRELTLRGIIIGGIITLVFTAANVYLGLKVGLTFATSIPAAVISMGILRFWKDHTVAENNIVQTIASAAGTLSAIIFVLPGLVMIGWWQGFPYWTTAILCAVGGILGVMYSIPLRRALVTGSDLPYPEGVAAAEVIKVGDTQSGSIENQKGLKAIILGGLAAAFYSLLGALKLIGTNLEIVFRVGRGGTMVSAGLSFAMLGVGHLVGLTVSIAMTIGMLLSYGVLLPYFSSVSIPAVSGGESGGFADHLGEVFRTDVRFIGAGAIAVAAVWTFIKVIAPIVRGIKEALRSNQARRQGNVLEKTEQDLPIAIVAGSIVVLMIPVALLLINFLQGTAVASSTKVIVLVGVLYAVIMGLAIASVCGYMAGLIGASNSPISGVGILVAITSALLIKLVVPVDSKTTLTLVAFTLFVTAVVFGIATISNDNLQDLKTGQLVGATPWKQQVALIIGVVFGSLVIPPVMELMNTAFGFQGMPNSGKDALSAPQASLISKLAEGVLGGQMRWDMLAIGVIIGLLAILLDEIGSHTGRFALPPLAVGMGIYLPMGLTILIPLGAVLGWMYNKWADQQPNREFAKRMGVLLSTGLIVGESLFGVLFAGIVAGSGNDAPLSLISNAPTYEAYAPWIGLLVFLLGAIWLYRRTRVLSK